MSDPSSATPPTSTNQLLLLIAAAAQQQQQQAAMQQQMAKIQKTPTAPSTSLGGTASSNGRNGGTIQNTAVAQQIAQLAQYGALLAAQKAQAEKKTTPKKATPPVATPALAAASTPIPGLSVEVMQAAWQQAVQLQALQQMMMTPQKNQMEEAIKKMMDMAKKKPPPNPSEPSTSSASSAGGGANGASNMMNNVMWQLVAQQMQQKQQQQQKDSQKRAEQAKRAKELAKQQQASKTKDEEHAKNKQQEEIMRFLIAQQQVMQQKKVQKKQEEAAALAAKVLSAHKAALESDCSEEGKRTTEMMLRLPLQLGWRRQTCVRSIAASGVKGDVCYFAPCGKKLSTYSETVRYLTKQGITYITRDNFMFTTKLVIGEFIVPKTSEVDDQRQEREFAMFTEDDINKELARLNALKNIPKMSTTPDEEKPQKVIEEPEEPLNPADLNDEFMEELVHMLSNGTDEMKVREREADDLLVNVNDVRHLPEFTRIENQCLSSQGFADALMIHEFVQNFGHVLGIDLEKTPKLEALCAGLAGDAAKADDILKLTRQLLRLALEYPGMGNEKRFGQGGGEMGLDRENFSEVMRLFLLDKGTRGAELSAPLIDHNFLELEAEQKASILAFLCDELVCSRNVVTEIDKNLDEISRLKGEKWMREGKARALRTARSKKRAEPAAPTGSDSEPSTRPQTPKKVVVNGSPAAPGTSGTSGTTSGTTSGLIRKFTPGLGQCEVLTEQEESMSLAQMESLISDLHQEALNINQKIHDTNAKIRSFPFGTDRFHRTYWMLAHTDAVLVESIASAAINNPACSVGEYAARDPPLLEHRIPEGMCEGMDLDVIACVEDMVDEIVLSRAKADKKTRRRYRRVENPMKRGWWTMPNKDSLESLRSCMLSRGIRERALHRLLTKPWFLNDLKFGTITLDPIGETSDQETIRRQGWKRLNEAIDRFQRHLKMSDVAKARFSDQLKPSVVPTTMALAQVVKDDVEWRTVEEEDVGPPDEHGTRVKIIETSEMVDSRFWRPRFRIQEGEETCGLYEEWKEYVMKEAKTSSQLMVALQALEGMIMWERSSREALCQICKSMDGDEMLVCDGCESGCHMECFRPRMTKVPEGDWFCQRCRQEKSGRPLCIFCGKESGHLHQCQRCAYHVHQECAQDGEKTKETINPSTFICPHCQEIKQMRFMKRIMLRSDSEEREAAMEDEQQQAPPPSTAVENGTSENSVPNKSLKRKLEAPLAPGIPKNLNKELCESMLNELVAQPNAEPFLEPVNGKLVPGYKMVIMKPIDLKTIRHKNDKMMYETPEDFFEDIELMFANCRQFNIDHSDIGRAGHALHKFFQKRWKQLKYNYTKRVRRLQRQS
uniref:Bromodomain adjacent to zinc finger domain protein 2B n=1 Tax=Caenorhabditis tropicalis TaxID=1561998 RepID=A0A1I7TWX6_9PELO